MQKPEAKPYKVIRTNLNVQVSDIRPFPWLSRLSHHFGEFLDFHRKILHAFRKKDGKAAEKAILAKAGNWTEDDSGRSCPSSAKSKPRSPKSVRTTGFLNPIFGRIGCGPPEAPLPVQVSCRNNVYAGAISTASKLARSFASGAFPSK